MSDDAEKEAERIAKYEAIKFKNFQGSCRLEGIEIPDRTGDPESLEEILARHRVARVPIKQFSGTYNPHEQSLSYPKNSTTK